MDPDGRKFKLSIYFTARKRSLGQGNDFTIVCHSVHGGDGGGGAGPLSQIPHPYQTETSHEQRTHQTEILPDRDPPQAENSPTRQRPPCI